MKAATQDNAKQRPIIQEDDTETGVFGQSLCMSKI